MRLGPIDKFPSSVAFDAINDVLNSSEADRKDAVKNGKAVFGITLKNPAGETESWFIDLAKEGKVVQGLDKSDGTFSGAYELPVPLFPSYRLPLLLTLS